jgi:hypothetical protein
MAKSVKKKKRKVVPKPKAAMDMAAISAVELIPDAWPTFEALVKSAGQMEHKPHTLTARTKTR